MEGNQRGGRGSCLGKTKPQALMGSGGRERVLLGIFRRLD